MNIWLLEKVSKECLLPRMHFDGARNYVVPIYHQHHRSYLCKIAAAFLRIGCTQNIPCLKLDNLKKKMMCFLLKDYGVLKQKAVQKYWTAEACPGSDLNRYGHCWPQDFKSCVSTNSTTRAMLCKNFFLQVLSPASPMLRGTNSTTRAGEYRISNKECWIMKENSKFLVRCSLPVGRQGYSFLRRAKKKNPPLREEIWSGRPGSNRPPRPWQGRALPNELLPLIGLWFAVWSLLLINLKLQTPNFKLF